MRFEDFALSRPVLAGVAKMGYEKPTPIQEQAIPPVLAGRDVLGLAQTGTGKTAAFALPILDRLLEGRRGVIRALVVAPTRELAEQIHQDFHALGGATRLHSATVYGGVGMVPQIKALKGRAEIIVACPGRLLDHMERGNADLSNLEVLVLDEADHMFDMGFLPAIRRILAKVPKSAQRLLFSATMPSELRYLADEVLSDPVAIEIGKRAPVATVSHALYPVEKSAKTALLKQLLRQHDPRSVLVFTRTKHGAKKLARQLEDDHFVASLQGNLSQNKRQQALDGFRDGKYNILVATDIAARGIDVSRVSHVINYDMPDTVEAYTHRIGRTGRAERNGEAFTFITRDDARMVRAIEGALGQKIARVEVDGYGFGPAGAGDGAGDARNRGYSGGRGNRGRSDHSRRNAGSSNLGRSKANGSNNGRSSGGSGNRTHDHGSRAGGGAPREPRRSDPMGAEPSRRRSRSGTANGARSDSGSR